MRERYQKGSQVYDKSSGEKVGTIIMDFTWGDQDKDYGKGFVGFLTNESKLDLCILDEFEDNYTTDQDFVWYDTREYERKNDRR